MSNMNLSNKYRVFRVLDNKYSIMSENDIRKTIWLLFRTQVSYLNIYNLRPLFWRNIYKFWCEDLTDESTRACDLSNHTKVPTKRRGDKYSSNIEGFHGRFSVISALRSPFKLKIFNYSHRRFSNWSYDFREFFIIFHCGLIHSGTLSWFI